MTRTPHLGIALPNYGPSISPAGIRRALQAAETSGFDSAWVTDHIAVTDDHAETYGTITEALVTLGYCAGLTERIHLGVSALVVPQREPVLAFKQLTSVDFLAEGRLILAVAAGWLAPEFELLGTRLQGRGRRLDDWLEFVAGATAQMPGAVTLEEPLRVDHLWFSPSFAREGVPMWSAGGSDAALARAARLGTWHPVGYSAPQVSEGAEKVRKRNPDARVVPRLGVSFVSEPDLGGLDERGRPSIAGPADWIAEQLARYVSAGSDGFVLMLTSQEENLEDRIHRFAEDVWPLVTGDKT
jgi:alkanesulfonate monooxygenase SsuD/methylene tetrahydromethanopterin reductase-like flavin-dependent oxidoreductase (luciferase family)